MTTFSRRDALALTAAGATFALGGKAVAAAVKNGLADLRPMTAQAQPISAAEHGARLARIQALMQQGKVAAFLVEAGSSLEYFTGVRWWRSERTTAALIPAHGRVIVVTPFFEEPSIRETLKVPADVRTWKEDESPFELLAGALRERAAGGGPLAVEPTTRLFIVERLSAASGQGHAVVPGDELIRACRMHKSPAELALMQTANDVTLAALRYTHAHVDAGMHGADILDMMIAATGALGGTHEFSLVLLNEASAYPHGSIKPQQVRVGSVILIDTGCSVHGYQSDISRSWVLGAASRRQRQVWDTVKQGQELALATAKLGSPVGGIDRAVRTFYEGRGWSKNYGLPGLSHRTGHGIGMDVHEAPYLVRSDPTPLEAGMCFSDEPGLYTPGEFGIRLEDCWYMTEAGPKTFTPLAKSLDEPI
ncbi:MAG TPA: Xaa-Pro peptidase family protein [Steroidobacteraceae bacterium]|jgi:Xaa-Pro dipeptidase|nr:Xaa-Pro peptidase family protein [Steroidobacteraceae bacterium]